MKKDKDQCEYEKAVRTMLRRNKTYREGKYGIGGIKKNRVLSPPVTLPKLKWMKGDDLDD